jgi:SAM-dependent methyltransferase
MPTQYNRQGNFMGGIRGQQKDAWKSTFPELYHARHQEYRDDIPFWLDLVRKQDSPFLELGCGTGRVMIPLVEAGYTGYGLDNDPNMLVYLHQQLTPTIQKNISTVLADMSSFQIKMLFPLIILPCNTFSTLDEDDRRSALHCIYQHLSTEGLFATSVPNPEILAHIESSDQTEIEMFFPHPRTMNPVQVSYSIERTEQNITLHWYYDHLLPDGKVERLMVSTSHYLTTTAQYRNEFANSGLLITEIYGDFNHSPHTSDSPNLIIIASKIGF